VGGGSATRGGPAAPPEAATAVEDLRDIRVDPELAGLIPPLSREERHRLEVSLLAEGGCRDPLLVWEGENILLDGHNRLALCREHGLPFKVKYVRLPNREAARAYIVGLQLGRRNLTPEAASYLRGKRYEAEKQPHGGGRPGAAASDQSEHLRTAQRLAREYHLGAATIRRDAGFARAVDAVVASCGGEARDLILSRDSGLSRLQVLWLADLGPGEQREYLRALKVDGRPPRGGRPAEPASIVLPRDPKSLAEKLLGRLGREDAAEVARLLAECLRREAPEG
jgi:hypothetical protein